MKAGLPYRADARPVPEDEVPINHPVLPGSPSTPEDNDPQCAIGGQMT